MTTKRNTAGQPVASNGSGKAARKAGARKTSGKAVIVATPWGRSVVVEELKVAQQAGDKRFATVVQLLESKAGEVLVRIAYTNDGVVRRGPVTLRPRDVERLNALLGARPKLAEALGRGGGAE